jgi:hypothetical protein
MAIAGRAANGTAIGRASAVRRRGRVLRAMRAGTERVCLRHIFALILTGRVLGGAMASRAETRPRHASGKCRALFITGSFARHFNKASRIGFFPVFGDQRMTWRCYAILMFVLALFTHPYAAAFAGDEGRGAGWVQIQRHNSPGDRGGDGPGRGQRRPYPDRPEGRENRFWGGPYWGYGARLGHPCRWCGANCADGEGNDSRCRRCMSRCGW